MTTEDILFQLLLLAIAVASNALSAIAGGGAGLIQLPVLIFLGLPFPIALATHKLASVALGIGASMRHLKSSSLQLSTSLIVIGAGLPGVILGANTILLIPEVVATRSLGVLTIALGLYSLRQKQLGQHSALRNQDLRGKLIGAAGLFFFGFLNGSLTSGTGLFVTLWLIHWFGFDYKQAIAHTLVLVGLFWNGTGALTLGLQQSIQWSWVPALLVGSMLGGYLGAHLSLRKGNGFIKRIFEMTTLAVGLKLLLL
jgi:hypothetical protein